MNQDATSLDTGQYTRKEIEKYEAIYGRNFVSPGGLAAAQEFCALLDLQPGMRVLDVGCGIGGGAFYMAQQFGARVDGIDLSTNMLAMASGRCAEQGLDATLNFFHGDILKFQPVQGYDRIYSRDVFLHIHNKVGLFAKLKECMLPGGKLLFSDYCCGEGTWSAEFASYVEQRQYALCTVPAYQSLLEQAGFRNVIAEDRTAQFIEILEREAANLHFADLDEQTKAELHQSWQSKIERARRGEQRWGLFIAFNG